MPLFYTVWQKKGNFMLLARNWNYGATASSAYIFWKGGYFVFCFTASGSKDILFLFRVTSEEKSQRGGKETGVLSASAQGSFRLHHGVASLLHPHVKLVFSLDLISKLAARLGKILTWATKTSCIGQSRQFSNGLIDPALLFFDTEDGRQNHVEETEVRTCETRADQPFLLQKPISRAKFGARTVSLQVPNAKKYTPSDSTTLLGWTTEKLCLRRIFLSPGKRSVKLFWPLFPRWEKENRLHPGLQKVQSTGGEEVHIWEEFESWGSHAGERGKRMAQSSITFQLHRLQTKCFMFFYLKALPDKQRHHACESSCFLGYTLQICRADEHQNAFQVAREKYLCLN